MNLKDFLKEVLGAYSEENSDKKEEKVGINLKNETREETNEEEDTKIIIDSEKDENEPGSGKNKEKKIDKVNENFELIKAKSDEKGIVESSATKEEKGDEKGNEPGSETSQLEDDKENSSEHFTKDDYEDYINDNMKLKGPVEEMSQEDGSSLSDDLKRNTGDDSDYDVDSNDIDEELGHKEGSGEDGSGKDGLAGNSTEINYDENEVELEGEEDPDDNDYDYGYDEESPVSRSRQKKSEPLEEALKELEEHDYVKKASAKSKEMMEPNSDDYSTGVD